MGALMEFYFDFSGQEEATRGFWHYASNFSSVLVALIGVSGAIIAAKIAFAGLLRRMNFEQEQKHREATSLGLAMYQEMEHRVHDLAWVCHELRRIKAEHLNKLLEQVNSEVLHEATNGSLDRIVAFSDRAWKELGKVAAEQMPDLAEVISCLETGCENIGALRISANSTAIRTSQIVAQYGKMERHAAQDASGAAEARKTELAAELVSIQKRFLDEFDKALLEIGDCTDTAIDVLKKNNPSAVFGHETLGPGATRYVSTS